MNASSPVLRGFGRAVRVVRKGRGWTLDDLASRLGTHRPIVGRVESGKHAPSLQTMVAYAAALEVPLGNLMFVAEKLAPLGPKPAPRPIVWVQGKPAATPKISGRWRRTSDDARVRVVESTDERVVYNRDGRRFAMGRAAFLATHERSR